MEKQFEKLNDLSVSALSEQKKYWQDVYNSAQAGSEAYNKAFDNLVKIRELEESRTKKNAEMDISAALSGNWDRTIEDTQKAIKLIEDFKKQLHVKTDSSAIDEANRAIEALNASLGKAKDGLMDYSEAFRIANEISSDVFDGTSEDIEKARKSLEAYRKTLKQKTDADTIKKADEALLNVAKSAESARRSTKSLDDILEDLDSASVEDLEEAAKQLKEQLKATFS